MNLLVTGGCGFIGSNFIRGWLENARPDGTIVNLDALTYAGDPANLSDLAGDARYVFVHGNICDQAGVTGLLAQHRIDAVVNFAAESHVDRSIDDPHPFLQTNVVGTERLLAASLRHRDTLPPEKRAHFRFLQISTDEVFGDLEPDAPPADEQTRYAPRSPYAATKAAADHLVRAFGTTYGLPVLITNCSNNFGPRQFPEKLIPLAISRALSGQPIPVYGDGLQIRDWIHVSDHVAAVSRVLRHGRTGETYLIGGTGGVTNLKLLRSLCAQLDEKVPRSGGGSYAEQLTHVADRPGHDRRYALNSGKIRRELEWSPQLSLEAGLSQTIDWYLDHRAWIDEIRKSRYDGARLGTPPNRTT